MTLPKNVAELQGENVVFELECIDRMYLNLYVPQLASAPGVAAYFRGYKGHRFASTKEAVAMSEGFRRQVLDFAERKATPIIRFEKGMRKDDVMHKRLRKFKAREGVVFIGIAQEKARVPRTIRKGFGEGEGTIPWIDYTTAMVKHYYFYCVDEDFGAFFIKFCSSFPYTGKLCINGHEYPMIAESWRRNWEQIIPFYSYPPEVRKIIYTTNAIESLHMQLRKVLKNRGHFPSDEAATKLIFLALRNITKSWKNPPLTWRMAANQFAIQFGERFNK